MARVPAPVFTTSLARRHGWTSDALRHAVRCGHLHRLRRGVYGLDDDPASAAIAAALAHPGGVVSHRSAALLLDLPLIGAAPPIPELTVSPRAPGDLTECHPYRAGTRPCDIVEAHGVPVLNAARTFADLARHRPLTTAVAFGDAMLREGLATADAVTDVLEFCRSWPRIVRARRAARLLDGRAESPLESISRLVLRALPVTFEPQKLIYDGAGRFVARVDFFCAEFGVVGEADGRSKYTDRSILDAEKDRQDCLADLGLETARWGWNEAWSQPARLLARVRAACERGELRERAGLPRTWQARDEPFPSERAHARLPAPL